MVLLHFRMFPPWKFEWKVHLFCFPHLCCFNDSWKTEKETPILIYTLTFAHRKKKQTTQDFWSWNFKGGGGIPTETHSSFLLALLQTNVQSHPSPASTDTYNWFQKGWRSRVLKGVTLRHAIKQIQKSEQDQKPEQLHPGIPLGPNFIILTSIY